MVVGEFAARGLEHFHVRIIEAPTGADAVEEDANSLARASALAKGVAERVPDFIRVKNVSLEVYCLLRAADSRQHGRKILISVLEQIDLVPGKRHRIRERERGHGE